MSDCEYTRLEGHKGHRSGANSIITHVCSTDACSPMEICVTGPDRRPDTGEMRLGVTAAFTVGLSRTLVVGWCRCHAGCDTPPDEASLTYDHSSLHPVFEVG